MAKLKKAEKADLDTILGDFSNHSKNIISRLEEIEREYGISLRGKEHDGRRILGNFHPRLMLFNNGLVWYAEGGGHEETPIGHPKDYLRIRDDFAALKEFLGDLLDKGRLYYGTSYHNQDGETKTSEYAAWMYRNSSNETFRHNFENAVVGLLQEELSSPKKFIVDGRDNRPYWQRQGETVRKHLKSLFSGDTPDLAAWRAGLGYPRTVEEQRLHDRFIEVMTGTLRKTGRNYETVRYADAPDEFKLIFERWYEQHSIREEAGRNARGTFARLIGLLEIIHSVGFPESGFSQASSTLERAINQKLYADSPDIKFSMSSGNIYGNLIRALGAIKTGVEIDSLLLSKMSKDPDSIRIEDYVVAIMHARIGNQEAMKGKIPEILAALGKRGYDTIQETTLDSILRTLMIWSHRPEDKIFMVGVPEYRLDRENNALNVFEGFSHEEPGIINFVVKSYSTSGVQVLKASYHLESGEYSGDPAIEKHARDLLTEKIPLPREETLDGLTARRIVDSKTLVIDVQGHNVNGMYEGIMDLRGDTPFLYDPKTRELLVGPQLDFNNRRIEENVPFFHLRYDLDLKERKVPFESLKPLSEANMAFIRPVLRQYLERGEEKYGVPLEYLKPHLTKILDAIVIASGHGLVK